MEYIVVYGAKINCEYGSTDSTFLEVPYDGCTIDDKNPVLESNLNIGDFVFCTLREQACVFKSLDKTWREPANCGTTEGKYITTKSVLFCQERGMLSITNPGQNCVAEVNGMLVVTDL
ncbi:PAAR-like protein [Flavobacterium hibernum]|uniref:DUF4280 domain-containing protein n=1 Tax=Flavobacterium hibernum TaxID=37752 RepID=A0A0D0EKE1_9FLAO|nr:PAAR-like protein [Flavobacterium hibernum]KIO51845.1 hypothetical protein IW18_16485 [Flavobacterium hibernum]OXA84279.1 hypothetical protein B0A73_20595 [Flavobacterium hibernum]STO18979.1 Uncharacterised protein [Flavobacterium hibernum]